MNDEPRSMGGDLPLTRRCWRGQHAACPGAWTRYPDESGPCECGCHDVVSLSKPEPLPVDHAREGAVRLSPRSKVAVGTVDVVLNDSPANPGQASYPLVWRPVMPDPLLAGAQ